MTPLTLGHARARIRTLCRVPHCDRSYAQAFCVHTTAIVVDTVPDPVNEGETHGFGADYLAAPVDATRLHAGVHAAITRHGLTRSRGTDRRPADRQSGACASRETAETACGIGACGEN